MKNPGGECPGQDAFTNTDTFHIQSRDVMPAGAAGERTLRRKSAEKTEVCGFYFAAHQHLCRPSLPRALKPRCLSKSIFFVGVSFFPTLLLFILGCCAVFFQFGVHHVLEMWVSRHFPPEVSLGLTFSGHLYKYWQEKFWKTSRLTPVLLKSA